MTHEDAVRIARSGEGAVVGELVRLSRLVASLQEIAERRIETILELQDKIEDMKKEHGNG